MQVPGHAPWSATPPLPQPLRSPQRDSQRSECCGVHCATPPPWLAVLLREHHGWTLFGLCKWLPEYWLQQSAMLQARLLISNNSNENWVFPVTTSWFVLSLVSPLLLSSQFQFHDYFVWFLHTYRYPWTLTPSSLVRYLFMLTPSSLVRYLFMLTPSSPVKHFFADWIANINDAVARAMTCYEDSPIDPMITFTLHSSSSITLAQDTTGTTSRSPVWPLQLLNDQIYMETTHHLTTPHHVVWLWIREKLHLFLPAVVPHSLTA